MGKAQLELFKKICNKLIKKNKIYDCGLNIKKKFYKLELKFKIESNID